MASTKSNLRKVLVLAAAAAATAAPYNYNYGGAGWGTVGAPDYFGASAATCATGVNQSPINIATAATTTIPTAALPALNLTYEDTTDWAFVSTVNYLEIGEIETATTPTYGAVATGNLGTAVTTSGNGITMDAYGYYMTGASAAGVYVPLSQYHFHTPSENTINGVHYPLEMHMVHKRFANYTNTSTTLTVATVVSIMFKLDDSDVASPFLTKLLTGNPLINTSTLYTTGATSIDGDVVFNLMTDVFATTKVGTTAYYAFNGSLTTPGCTEGLNWRVMATPLSMSRAQLAIFRTALSLKQGGNSQGSDNRNVQPLNARTILASPATIVTISAAPKAVASVAALVAVVAAAIAF